MTSYRVHKGDTIARVTQHMQTDWQTLKRQNPGAVGKSKRNGHWFLKEGAEVKVDEGSFSSILEQATKKTDAGTKTGVGRNSDEYTTYTVQPGDTLWGLAVGKFHEKLQALVSDNGIQNPDLIQVGQKLKIRKDDPQPPSQVVASWYGRDFQGKPMANGAPYDMYANTIAHKDLPLGTKVELNNPRTGQTITAVVTDRGPYVAGRDVDLSYGVARKLSMVETGVDTLIMKVL
jgi:peptidoglycan lytic transglycosylase